MLDIDGTLTNNKNEVSYYTKTFIKRLVENGIKVAMNNAIDELKKSADYITKYSNDKDGIVRFLDFYFNNIND